MRRRFTSRAGSHHAALAVGLAALVGCADLSPLAPQPTSMTPGATAEGSSVPVVISGTGFSADVAVSYRHASSSRLDLSFTARLGTEPLTDVTYVSPTELHATVPAGLLAGVYALTVADAAGREGSLADAFVVLPAGAVQLAFTGQPMDAVVGATLAAVQVEVRDALGNAVPGAASAISLQLSSNPGSAVLSGTTTVNAAAGVATFSDLSLDQPGVGYAITATSPGLADAISSSFNIAVVAGPPARLGFIAQPTNVATLATIAPAVRVAIQDAQGVTVATSTASVTIAFGNNPGGGTLAGTATVAAVGGVATFANLSIDSVGAGYTLTATSAGLAPATSAPFNVTAAANSAPLPKLKVTPGAGTTSTLFAASSAGTVDLQDAAGALIYRWDWDNDGTFDATGPTASTTYATTGAFTVVLEVEDTGGLRAQDTFVVFVAAAPDLLTVTTAVDENNASATPAAPGGTGFSLREAIAYANATAGAQTILVPSGMAVALASPLPVLNDPSGARISGYGASVDGSALGGGAHCFRINSNNNRILGLEIHDCGGLAIELSGGTGNQVAACFIHDNARSVSWVGSGSNVFGPGNEVANHAQPGVTVGASNTVEGNRIHHNTQAAIVLPNGSDGAVVRGNIIYANASGLSIGNNADGLVVQHNTIYGQTGDGVTITVNSTGVDFRNNILSQNGGWGINGSSSSFAALDFDDFFANADGACSNCTSLGPSSSTVNPSFIRAASADFRLQASSPLINAGANLGIDVNGPAPGNFNGALPDLGALEAP